MNENNKSVRVIIYGAGAVGGVVGGHLARAGNDVILIGRPGHMNAIREHGLRLVTPTGTHTLPLQAVTAPDQINFGPDDVVFLCVKGQSTEEALHELRKVVEDVPIFCFQNGVRNEETATQYFPRVYGVRVVCGGVFLTNGEVMARWDPPGWFIMGRYPKGTDDLVETVATSLRHAGFYVLVSPDVMPYKWGKLMRNLVAAIGAITNDIAGNDYTRLAEALRKETREILAQAGIRWMSDEEVALEWPESTIQPRSNPDLRVKNSSWQSLTRQQGSVETDFFNGEIVRLAKQLGRQAPINETLLRIMKEMAANREPPGKYTLAELRRLIGLD
ncbi:ketopantoate reductase family protein [Chloroflexota bacterium]